jgi:hypothetical protein
MCCGNAAALFHALRSPLGVLPDRIADSSSAKRGQQFIGPHDETPSIVAMCVNNPDCAPLGING